MKRYFLLLTILMNSMAIAAQGEESDKIVGLWKSPDNSLMIKIDKIGDQFQGRIVWVAQTDMSQIQLDENNPDQQLRKLPLKGNKIIKELSFNPQDSKWIGGVFYNHAEGKHYRCQISYHSPNQIRITKFMADQQNGGIHEIWSKQR